MPRPVIRPYTGSIEFNGTTSKLVKTTPTGLNTGSSALSFVSWVYPKTKGLQIVADLIAPTMGRRFALGDGGGSVFFFFSDGINANNNMTLSAAQYFAAFGFKKAVRCVWTVDATEAQFYADAVLIKTQSLGTPMNSGAYSSLTLGLSGSGTLGFGGWQNDAYFANQKMNLNAVRADYFNARRPSAAASAWMMNEGSGTNVADDLGSNSLTATDITWSTVLPTKARTAASARGVSSSRTAASARSAA